MKFDRTLRARSLMSLIGVLLCGISVGFLRQADFGVDPFQCLCLGIANVVPLDYGTLYVFINAAFLLFMLWLSRKSIGIATFLNMFFLGYVIDFSQKILVSLYGVPSALPWRVANLAAGLLIISFASSMIFESDLGVSTYDWIALRITEAQGRVPFRFVRISTDLVCVGVGLALGVLPGVGTILTALCMGPVIELFRRTVAQPMLKRLAGD